MLASIFDAFVEQSPISVMMRGVMEHVFRPQRLDEIFESHSKVQYSRELLFSSLVNLLSLVVCGVHPSVNAAYKAKAEELNVTRSALYQKLNGVETEVSAALLRETASELGQLIQRIGGEHPPLLNGYQVRIQGWECVGRDRASLGSATLGRCCPVTGEIPGGSRPNVTTSG